MSMNRRQFIKLAGISTVLGIGGLTAAGKLGAQAVVETPPAAPDASSVFQTPTALKAKRWGMVIDLSKFNNPELYQKCITACHSIHNVPDWHDKQHEVKWIWTDDYEHSFPDTENPYMPETIKEKPFLLLCNHCDNPPCVRVCPTQATFRRPDGIVMQDMHRCIGCRFCMAACPYGSRSFNWKNPRLALKKVNPDYPTRTIGVVEKCTFCTERLVKGLQPACVEVSEGAIIFGDLADPNSDVRKALGKRYNISRKPELGTKPSVYYLIGGAENA
jgi:Fe-S-cluster-containing dehydrogenase component